MSSIVIATFGSLGDLHPYLGIAVELQARGHRAAIATSGMHRERVEAEGFGFHAVRPDIPEPGSEGVRRVIRRVMDPAHGTEYLFREMLMPALRDSYDDLLAACAGADLIVTHPTTFAGPLVAEKLGIHWASSVLSPISFFSAYEPLALPPSRLLSRLYALGPTAARLLVRVMGRVIRPWFAPVAQLRREVGLPPGGHPALEGQHSPELVLALFSEAFAPRRPDWPPHTCATGFIFYDGGVAPGLPPEALRFLDAGPAPVVFTLGSSVVMDPGEFFAESRAAAGRLGVRAVLLAGPDAAPAEPEEGVLVVPYAPHAEVFPRAAAVVHHGGIGTTAQGLRAGRPALVVPFSHDQPDNAARLVRLGVARSIGPREYRAGRVAPELKPLLEEPAYTERAQEIARRIRSEDGPRVAANAIEGLLRVR